MAVTARKDWDRLAAGIATGNVITGINTTSAAFGTDILSPAPDKITAIKFGANPPVAVIAGGTDIVGTFGTLHINPDGTYTYTRALTNIYSAGGLAPGATDAFTYTLTDGNAN